MTWLAFCIAVLVCGAYVLLPGGLLLRLLAAPPWAVVAFAPVVSAALTGVFAIAYAELGLSFNAVTFCLGALALLAGAFVVRRRRVTRRGPGWSVRMWAALGIGLAVSMAVWALEWAWRLGRPDSIAKGYDIPWHLSIVQRILSTGDASSVDAGHVVQTLGSGFYPASWHALVALVVQSSPASLATSVNATIFVVMALVWPLSVVALAVVVLGRSVQVVLVAGVLSSSFVAFPFWFVAHGGLYANQYGDALVPALIAATAGVLRGQFSTRGGPLLVLASLLGCAIAQPNTVFTAAVLVFPFGLDWLYRRVRSRGRASALGAVAAAVVTVLVGWVLVERMPFMHRTLAVDWPTFASTPQAIWQAATGGYLSVSPTWLTTTLVLVGAIAAVKVARGLLAAHVMISALYVLVASRGVRASLPGLRTYATGYWYHDSERLAAACIVTALPLAVLGAVVAGRLIGRIAWRPAGRFAVPVIAAVVLAGSLTSAAMRGRTYLVEQDAPLRAAGVAPEYTITTQKLAFMEAAAGLVGHSGVANDPDDGSAYAYGLTGLDVYFKAYPGNWMGSQSPDMIKIRSRLVDVATDPSVCPVLERHHIRYALQMERTGGFFARRFTPVDGPRGIFKGLELHRTTPGFVLILEMPGMRLFRITACG